MQQGPFFASRCCVRTGRRVTRCAGPWRPAGRNMGEGAGAGFSMRAAAFPCRTMDSTRKRVKSRPHRPGIGVFFCVFS